MSKKIAVFGWKVGENSFGVTLPYYTFLNNFGEVNILSPVKNIDFSLYDLLVVPGGPDVNPATYGYIPSLTTSFSDPIREYYDTYLLPQAIKQHIPIVGICRGHQSIAVRFGAPLTQNMYHETNPSRERGKLVHELDINTEELPELLRKELNNILKSSNRIKNENRKGQEVNSMHHQVVREVPNEAVLLATHYHKENKGDKSIEALYYPKQNIFTFQYHPEEIWDDLSLTCIGYLLTLKDIKNAEKEVVFAENK